MPTAADVHENAADGTAGVAVSMGGLSSSILFHFHFFDTF
jgi:hypothetical protein